MIDLSRQKLKRSWGEISGMPDVWTTTADATRNEDGNETYSRGLAAGLEIAARGAAGPLTRLLAALPACEHGAKVNETCSKGCDPT